MLYQQPNTNIVQDLKIKEWQSFEDKIFNRYSNNELHYIHKALTTIRDFIQQRKNGNNIEIFILDGICVRYSKDKVLPDYMNDILSKSKYGLNGYTVFDDIYVKIKSFNGALYIEDKINYGIINSDLDDILYKANEMIYNISYQLS